MTKPKNMHTPYLCSFDGLLGDAQGLGVSFGLKLVFAVVNKQLLDRLQIKGKRPEHHLR